MNAVTPVEPESEADPAAAFEGLSRKVAGLTAAIEGMAKRQQELHARDYRPELNGYANELSQVKDKLTILTRSPALELTPERVGNAIEAASRRGRDADSQALTQARQELASAASTLQRMIATLNDARIWSRWTAGASGAALLIGIMLGYFIFRMFN